MTIPLTTDLDKQAIAFIHDALAELRESGTPDDELHFEFEKNMVKMLLKHRLLQTENHEQPQT